MSKKAPRVVTCPPLHMDAQAEPSASLPPFFDVFISYRHRDEAAVAQLEARIREAGFTTFCDRNIPSLNDPQQVTRQTIETIRRHISRSTCLLVAYSRASAAQDAMTGEQVGMWIPWELGYFDGALSQRLGVYLLDGPRNDAPVAAFYKGCEYLQLYDEVSADTLDDYLRAHAVRERRIDNVNSAFAWGEQLTRECMSNPGNVALGVAEWLSDHTARWWTLAGNPAMAQACRNYKTQLGEWRNSTAPAWRNPAAEALLTWLSQPGEAAESAATLPTKAGPARW